MGGEKFLSALPCNPECGSPPRGRGKDERRRPGEIRARITPAWAGKRSSLDGKMFKIWDHPRVGGEKSISCWKRSMPVGSPPRGRGKVAYIGNKNGLDGITPAWAGKSLGICACFPLVQDHPRVGGEKDARRFQLVDEIGSPPRGRGKARKVLDDALKDGITPAWAGKRSSASR